MLTTGTHCLTLLHRSPVAKLHAAFQTPSPQTGVMHVASADVASAQRHFVLGQVQRPERAQDEHMLRHRS